MPERILVRRTVQQLVETIDARRHPRVATAPGDSALMPAQITPFMLALIFLNLPSA
ncbi:hypothetical protein M5E06_26640 [Azospirillum sp. A1-3]|uniref:hypothetical protein n=1 Tax=Azospirillum sp. A1-3 TaxID=185874 RepID=UPI00207714E7|nr:hypothetical protein [Azospirillum sp. A1-3]MCM8737703.1 hypothetical protein [Azospirillum sp. A1-3]